MKKAPDPLALSAVRGARIVALDRLDAAGDAAGQLAEDPEDLGALHDLRVSLRRLRSWLRAFKPELDDIGKKDRHSLRDLVDETNRGRDADVQLDWLENHVRQRDGEWTLGVEKLIGAIELEQKTVKPPLAGDWLREFDKVRTRLAGHLSTVRESVRGDDPAPPTLAAAIGARLPGLLDVLRGELASIHVATDERQAHAARIAAKRLRYVLEPAEDVRGGRSILTRLKSLQDELGELHDVHLLEHRVQEALLGVPAADRAPFDALADVLAAERGMLFRRVEQHWLRDEAAMAAFGRSVNRLAAGLAKYDHAPRRHR
jgi:CHAD domain-containing protein